MTKEDAADIVKRMGYRTRFEFDTGTAQIEGQPLMSVAEFIAYARGLQEGAKWGYEGNSL